MTGRTIIPTRRPWLIRAALPLALAGIVVVMLLALAGVFHSKIPDSLAAPVSRPVGDAPLAEVRAIETPIIETAVGSVRAVQETAVGSRILARVAEVRVRAGQEVAKGELLVRLDDSDLKARLKQAEATVTAARAARDQAQVEYDRVVDLYQRSMAAKIEMDRVDAALKTAEAELNRAEQARHEAEAVLGYAEIVAPSVGRVVDKRIEEGDMVAPSQVLLTLYDPTRMQLVARVRESLTQRLVVGQLIDVRIDALDKTCQGTISEIVPEAESASRTFSVKVTGPCPPGVYSGMFGRLLVPLTPQRVLVVPRSAIRRVGQLDLVDVAAGEQLHRRAVQLGRTFGDDVEVLSGLREAERVVASAR
ncbi:MAG: efflux RND transporter periplasmic adaptor subunit [Phycisphaerae bacterium]|nr:efflux RND transporter periplasmic adaptor subunit [Phycisphaerae bacterium]NUQ46385.1 efflux RND transporter periplasmic adaptor subunit [Phycisphaerae bacterium]